MQFNISCIYNLHTPLLYIPFEYVAFRTQLQGSIHFGVVQVEGKLFLWSLFNGVESLAGRVALFHVC